MSVKAEAIIVPVALFVGLVAMPRRRLVPAGLLRLDAAFAVLLLVGLLVVGAALLATSANITRAMLTTFAQ